MSRLSVRVRRAFATAALLAAAAPATAAAARHDVCVGARPGCFATVQAALDAARDGGGGPHVFGTLVMRDSTVVDNSVVGTVPAGSPGNVNVTSGGIEIDDNATVTGSRFEDNRVEATGPNDVLAAGAGIALAPLDGEAATIRDSRVRRNSLIAKAGSGSATAQGAGIQTVGSLVLSDVEIERNAAAATGPAGVAQGGGIWNATATFDGAPPAPLLTLRDTTIRRNALEASAGIAVHGGGLFTDSPITRDHTRIADNAPDDCFGC